MSALARQIIRFPAGYPLRISVGISFGFLLKVAVVLLSASFNENALFQKLAEFPTYYFMIIATGILFIPFMFGYRKISANAREQILVIEQLMEKSELTEPQRQLIWRLLIQKYVQDIRPDFTPEIDTELVQREFERRRPRS